MAASKTKVSPEAYKSSQQRSEAIVGAVGSVDACMDMLEANAELMFQPKRVTHKGDWLAAVRESGQTVKRYQQGGPNISWSNARNNTIYVFFIDDQLAADDFQQQLGYLAAFFPGMILKTLRPGKHVTVANPMGEKRRLPNNFLETHAIRTRLNEFEEVQYNAADINTSLATYLPKGAFAMVGLLNSDLYPSEENDKGLSMVKGLACPATCTGVFSFARNPREAEEWQETVAETLSRVCNVMTHEVCHLFGLQHCPYYECLMNGAASPDEGRRRPKPILLCPICLKKLKLNLKFDVAERFRHLLAVAMDLGFVQEAIAYQSFLQS